MGLKIFLMNPLGGFLIKAFDNSIIFAITN